MLYSLVIHIIRKFAKKLGYLLIFLSGDSRLSIQGGHDSRSTIMFIVKPLHYKLDFLHLYTLKIGLKTHFWVLKILGLAMPMHLSTFHQDFPQLNVAAFD